MLFMREMFEIKAMISDSLIVVCLHCLAYFGVGNLLPVSVYWIFQFKDSVPYLLL